MMKTRINNALINSYCDRINASGISVDRKTLRNKINNLELDELNDYMINILNNSNANIISTLNDMGVKARNNKKISKIKAIMKEMQKHFPNSEIAYNSNNNTFSVIDDENITLKLVKDNDKYRVQKINSEENTNSSNTNSKGKQYTLSNGKQSSKLFMDNEAA